MAVEKDLLKGIELLKEGKEEGFNILYSHTYNYVYGRAKVIMKNDDDALDLTQETFIQAYKGIKQLEDVNNIYAWLSGITYRQGMKMFRKRKEVLVGEDAEGIFEDVEDNDSDYHPEASADEKATSDIVKSMIEELPELQKATIMAYYYDNMKIDDIAEVFECSSNTVKSRLNYAKKFLKTKVEEHEKENRYRLHSLTPAVFVFAFRSIVSGDKYLMSVETAQSVYEGVCAGVASKVIAAEEAGTVASKAVATAETAGASTGTASTATGAGGVAVETTVKAGMSIGMKLVLGAAAVLTVGAVTIGDMSLGCYTKTTGGNQTQDEQKPAEESEADEDVQEEKRRKYVVHYESSTISGAMVSMDRQYEFDDNGFILKMTEQDSNGNSIVIEMKWENIEDGYIARSYYPGGMLQGVTYYDKDLNSRRSESYNIETGNLQAEYDYNENGDIVKQITYYPDGSMETRIENEYDAFGNQIKAYSYNAKGNLGNPHEVVYNYSYDYDENHRILRKYLEGTHYADYEYDDANHTVREVIDGAVLQEWVYDENETLRSRYTRNLSFEIYFYYDEDGYLIEQTTKQHGEVLNSLKYTYKSVEELRGIE